MRASTMSPWKPLSRPRCFFLAQDSSGGLVHRGVVNHAPNTNVSLVTTEGTGDSAALLFCDLATFALRTRRPKTRLPPNRSIGIPGLRTLVHVRLGFLSTLLFSLLALCSLGRLCAFALAFFKSVVGSAGHATSIVGMGSLSGRSPKRCLGGPSSTDVQDGLLVPSAYIARDARAGNPFWNKSSLRAVA